MLSVQVLIITFTCTHTWSLHCSLSPCRCQVDKAVPLHFALPPLQHLSITEESVILSFWMKTTGIASFPDPYIPCSLFSWTVVYVKGRAIGNREMLSGGKEGGIILNSVLDSNNCCTKIVRQFTFNAGMWLINRRSCLYFEN